ncbi:NAD(P)-dependent dehydrogenase, short-chain alcohol dehydrogenase family [Glycomyces sambucus]|uniref:NAD(P)-dependent dehydrogenase, short-chain alcohol dehydrogenase family n=1 Tax=Glycomyces sambucus TaxID=380244 RepID=A0A1G9M3V8_9ACTN|nr:oxidoreductase [Glycomyces sambucus]SDL68972.1 NAD(P)-dependent dehydrogenase, short-chain alcohol dehydrogenase family [Glycomyces sambucus]
MSRDWSTADIPDQAGRTFLITGANSGLGLETAKAVAARGARVVMAVRTPAKGEAAAAAIKAEVPGADLEVRRLDLADLDAVRSFAEGFDTGIDVLVNNAGIMAPPRSLSKQGHESQFATNHLGHFALTGLLLDRLQGPDPRVVTVASLASNHGDVYFDDLTGERRYSATRYYGQSKLANLLFGIELDRRLRAAGNPAKSVMAHPGLSATDLLQSMRPVVRFIGRVLMPLATQPASTGALPQLYAATEPKAEGGQYIGPRHRGEHQGPPVIVRARAEAYDPATARRLWDVSEELTRVRFPLPATA